MTRYDFDKGDNLCEIEETEVSPLLTSAEVFATRYEYDSLNRQVLTVEPNGQETVYEYDSRGNAVRRTDELGNQIDLFYDRLNRQLSSKKWLSVVSGGQAVGASSANHDLSQGGGDGVVTMSQRWDQLHRVIERTDDRGNTTEYRFDDLSRLVLKTYADQTVEAWKFNADSELQEYTDQNASKTTYFHDPEGRPYFSSTVAGPGVGGVGGDVDRYYTYSSLGDLWCSIDYNNSQGINVVTLFYHDSLRRTIREHQSIGAFQAIVDTEYQGARRVVAQTYPNQRRVLRSYDALDRLSEIREGANGALILRNDYVGRWRTVFQAYGNGTTLDKRNDLIQGQPRQTIGGSGPGYDSNRRSLRHDWKMGSVDITSYAASYNGVNGVGTNRQLEETAGHLGDDYVWGLDASYRSTAFDRDGVLSSRVLDGVDRMTSFSDEGVLQGPVVDAFAVSAEDGLNQYSRFGHRADGLPYERTYDKNGNRLDDGLGGRTFDFDGFNRIVRVKDPSGAVLWRYLYDGLGRLVVRYNGSEARYYTYSGWRVVQEDHVTDGLVQQYVDGAGLDEHVQMKRIQGSAESTYYYHCNRQGFVGALSDDSGVPVEYYRYSWFGDVTVLASDKVTELGASAYGNEYFFQGRRYLGDAALYWFRTRFYDSFSGEFLSIDRGGLWRHGQGNGYSAFDEGFWDMVDPWGLDTYIIVVGNDKDKSGRGLLEKCRSAAANQERAIRKRKGFDPKKDKIVVLDNGNDQGSTQDIIDAFENNDDIVELVYFGHSSPERVLLDPGHEFTPDDWKDTQFTEEGGKDGGASHDSTKVSDIPTKNCKDGFEIKIYGCSARATPSDGGDSIAETLAKHFNARVLAADCGVNFTGNGQPMIRQKYLKGGKEGFAWVSPDPGVAPEALPADPPIPMPVPPRF